MTNSESLVGASGRGALDFMSKHRCTITQQIHAALLLRCWCVLREHLGDIHFSVSLHIEEDIDGPKLMDMTGLTSHDILAMFDLTPIAYKRTVPYRNGQKHSGLAAASLDDQPIL